MSTGGCTMYINTQKHTASTMESPLLCIPQIVQENSLLKQELEYQQSWTRQGRIQPKRATWVGEQYVE